jgi:3-oxoacyl-[acyl-carrier-protein] synthase II
LRPGDLDYIQAHGTGTVANDRAESESLKRALGSDAARVPISSLKPYFGHLSMAAGALEVLASVIVLRSQQLPVCLNLDEPEAGCDHAFVRDRNPRGEVKTILKNSFGFGGQNACLVLGKGLS